MSENLHPPESSTTSCVLRAAHVFVASVDVYSQAYVCALCKTCVWGGGAGGGGRQTSVAGGREGVAEGGAHGVGHQVYPILAVHFNVC